MKKQHTFRPVALRFRRWSRKVYATFISIQRAVTIGQLTANVSERFQTKNGSVHSSVLLTDQVADKYAGAGSDLAEEVNSLPACLVFGFFSILLPVQTIRQSVAPAFAYHYYTISVKAEGFCKKQSPSAFFCA